MNSLRLIDFAPVILAAVTVTLGLGLAKLLVFLHHRQNSSRSK